MCAYAWASSACMLRLWVLSAFLCSLFKNMMFNVHPVQSSIYFTPSMHPCMHASLRLSIPLSFPPLWFSISRFLSFCSLFSLFLSHVVFDSVAGFCACAIIECMRHDRIYFSSIHLCRYSISLSSLGLFRLLSLRSLDLCLLSRSPPTLPPSLPPSVDRARSRSRFLFWKHIWCMYESTNFLFLFLSPLCHLTPSLTHSPSPSHLPIERLTYP
jgi:hypothetical protein